MYVSGYIIVFGFMLTPGQLITNGKVFNTISVNTKYVLVTYVFIKCIYGINSLLLHTCFL